MSAFYENLCDEIANRLAVDFNTREGRVIPSSSDVALTNGAVRVDAAFLYADLAGSSVLSQICPWQTTAKVIKAYLYVCSRLIRAWGGEIRSFDGDRVMGVFMGQTPCNDAVRCAREIDYTVHYAVNPMSKANFNSIRSNGIEIRHCVGIDFGEAHAVRGGIRDNNDLLWIGRPPSFAAKLSDVREYPYEVFVSEVVYDRLEDSQKFSNGSHIWRQSVQTFASVRESVYSTTSILKP